MLKGAVGALGATVLGCGTLRAASTKRPNFVFVLIDDQAWNAMGHTGRFPFLKTPHMDRLAREGASFENAFVTTSLCSPSRASLLTGCHAHRHGVRTNEKRDPDPGLETFPQRLQRAGYETAFVGKWHMEPTANPRPGFDYWLSFRGQGQYVNPKLNENGRDFQQEGYMTDLLTGYATRWLERPREKPFCLLLWHKAVHGPFTPAPRHAEAFPEAALPKPPNFDDTFEDKPKWLRHMKTYGGRRDDVLKNKDREPPDALPPAEWNGGQRHQLDYLRALLAVDESIGAVLVTLEKQGTLDDTVVIFSSDNGYFLGEHRLGDKRLMYEESIRIPLIVRYPALAAAGARLEPMALNIDVAPTILELAGARPPRTIQGRSLVPLLGNAGAPWRDSFLYAYYQEGWLPGIPTMLGVRTKRWKYIHYPGLPEDVDELYDLEGDPHELRNLVADPAHADTLARMQATLKRLLDETDYVEASRGPAPIDMPLSLALHYAFDTQKDSLVRDESGHDRHGRLYQARVVESPRGGHACKALALDGGGYVVVPTDHEAFSPAMKPLTVGGWCRPEAGDGVLISFGGQTHGFALYLKQGVPHFAVISGGAPSVVSGAAAIGVKQWVHVMGMLTRDCRLRVYVNGEGVGQAGCSDFIPAKPNEGCTVGADLGTLVGDYRDPLHWHGLIGDVRLYWGELGPRQLRRWLGK